MHWKRFAHAFLLGTGVCVLSAGCAAFNALVSSPAGSGADSNSPERLAAIGRVFENQGRYAQAQTMYRRTLKMQPNNSFVQQRLEYLASRTKSRKFNGAAQQTTEAVAAADRIQTRREPAQQPLPNRGQGVAKNQFATMAAAASTAPQSVVTPPVKTVSAAKPVTETLNEVTLTETETPVIEKADDLVFADAPGPEPQADESTEAAEPLLPAVDELEAVNEESTAVFAEIEAELLRTADSRESVAQESDPEETVSAPELPVADVAEETDDFGQADFGVEFAALTDDTDSEQATLEFAPGRKNEDAKSELTQVAFDGSSDDTSGWKATERQVTLAEVLSWLEQPADFETELISALRHGEDDGVKALAASALAECTAETIEDELRSASSDESPLVRATVVESLMSRGCLQEQDVDTLLELMSSPDADIRAQAAGCLRFLAGGEWEKQCVAGLAGLLQDADAAVIAMAASTLGDFGAAASGHRVILKQLQLEANDIIVSEAAALAVRRIPATGAEEVSAELP